MLDFYAWGIWGGYLICISHVHVVVDVLLLFLLLLLVLALVLVTVVQYLGFTIFHLSTCTHSC